jgi:Phage terminase small subunit
VHVGTSEAWERQDGETPEAFEAFALYRDMGPDRSLRRVAKELHKSLTIVRRWSADNRWRDRVAAWDGEQDRVKREGYLEEIRDVGRRQAETARRHAGALSLPAVEIARRLERDEGALAAMDTSALLGLAVKAAKPLAQLMHAEREAVTVSVKDEQSSPSEQVCSSCRAQSMSDDVSNWTREEAREYLLGLDDRQDSEFEEDERFLRQRP